VAGASGIGVARPTSKRSLSRFGGSATIMPASDYVSGRWASERDRSTFTVERYRVSVGAPRGFSVFVGGRVFLKAHA
jgi:hypothetical protein